MQGDSSLRDEIVINRCPPQVGVNSSSWVGQQKDNVTGAMRRGGQWRAGSLSHKSRKDVWVLLRLKCGATVGTEQRRGWYDLAF